MKKTISNWRHQRRTHSKLKREKQALAQEVARLRGTLESVAELMETRQRACLKGAGQLEREGQDAAWDRAMAERYGEIAKLLRERAR